MIGGVDPRKLFTSNGYVNIPALFNSKATFIWIIGGRGTGKTYTTLEFLSKEELNFLMLRRTNTQVESLARPETHPFKKLNADLKTHITTAPVNESITGFYNFAEDEGKVIPQGCPVGYMAALSTFAKLRGIDFSDIDVIFFDEFIKEPNESSIKREAECLFNAYETVNRNRELEGKPPVKLIAAANSNQLDNPYFLELGFVTIVERMNKEGKTIKYLPEQDSLIVLLDDSPISEKKFNTALYKLTRGSRYQEMALKNDYGVNKDRYRSLSTKGMKPTVTIGEITIYKMNENFYYCTPHKSGSPDNYTTAAEDIRLFKIKYRWLATKYQLNKIVFESYWTEACFLNYWK